MVYEYILAQTMDDTTAQFSVSGLCPILDGGMCVGSPNFPGGYGNNQHCWIYPRSQMLHVVPLRLGTLMIC